MRAMQPTSPVGAPSTTPPGKAALWGGWALSGLVGAMLIMSGAMKIMGGAEVAASLAHLGFPDDIAMTLAVLELGAVALYLIPQTAVFGAILITGYLGGAICAHMRLGEPSTIPLALGVVAWAALYLREPRLRRLLPLRAL